MPLEYSYRAVGIIQADERSRSEHDRPTEQGRLGSLIPDGLEQLQDILVAAELERRLHAEEAAWSAMEGRRRDA